jgi:hypothetical protein
MATLRSLEREVLRRKHGNGQLSKIYKNIKNKLRVGGLKAASKKVHQKKSLFKKLFSFKK